MPADAARGGSVAFYYETETDEYDWQARWLIYRHAPPSAGGVPRQLLLPI